jgi:hypothetical protein
MVPNSIGTARMSSIWPTTMLRLSIGQFLWSPRIGRLTRITSSGSISGGYRYVRRALDVKKPRAARLLNGLVSLQSFQSSINFVERVLDGQFPEFTICHEFSETLLIALHAIDHDAFRVARYSARDRSDTSQNAVWGPRRLTLLGEHLRVRRENQPARNGDLPSAPH